jgi:hypothetical protein
MLGYTAGTWTGVIVGCSIFVPLVVTIVLAFFFLRSARHDPDHERLRRVQREYEATRER